MDLQKSIKRTQQQITTVKKRLNLGYEIIFPTSACVNGSGMVVLYPGTRLCTGVGVIKSSKSRKRFFNDEIKLNEMLPGLVFDFWQRLNVTLAQLRKNMK